MFAVVSLALLSAVARAALSSDDVKLIESQFAAAELDPLFAPNNFTTEGLLTAHWAATNASISIGKPVEPEQATQFPETIHIIPADGSENFDANSTYTALLIDANVVGTPLNGTNQNLHWLINHIHLNTSSTANYPLIYENGTTVKQYQGPSPADGSGPHRYVFLIFAEGDNFTAPADYASQDQIGDVQLFDYQQYVNQSNLGPIVGSTFFTVQVGADNSSVPATSTVSGTLGVPTDGTAPSATSTSSGNTSATSGVSGSGASSAPSATGTSGAGRILPTFGLAAAAMAIAALL